MQLNLPGKISSWSRRNCFSWKRHNPNDYCVSSRMTRHQTERWNAFPLRFHPWWNVVSRPFIRWKHEEQVQLQLRKIGNWDITCNEIWQHSCNNWVNNFDNHKKIIWMTSGSDRNLVLEKEILEMAWQSLRWVSLNHNCRICKKWSKTQVSGMKKSPRLPPPSLTYIPSSKNWPCWL